MERTTDINTDTQEAQKEGKKGRADVKKEGRTDRQRDRQKEVQGQQSEKCADTVDAAQNDPISYQYLFSSQTAILKIHESDLNKKKKDHTRMVIK